MCFLLWAVLSCVRVLFDVVVFIETLLIRVVCVCFVLVCLLVCFCAYVAVLCFVRSCSGC